MRGDWKGWVCGVERIAIKLWVHFAGKQGLIDERERKKG
jgi:hypothetical protein